MLFAALDVAQGKLIGSCMARHRHQEWLAFFTLIVQQTPHDLDLHIIADNYAAHKHPQVKAWLKRHPCFHMHFTPTSASWLTLVERWFAEITDKRIRRGLFKGVTELKDAFFAYIEAHNENPKCFTWTAKAVIAFYPDWGRCRKWSRQARHRPMWVRTSAMGACISMRKPTSAGFIGASGVLTRPRAGFMSAHD